VLMKEEYESYPCTWMGGAGEEICARLPPSPGSDSRLEIVGRLLDLLHVLRVRSTEAESGA